MFFITNLTKKRAPKVNWRQIAVEVLGKKYDLSVVLAGDRFMKKLNETYRRQNKPASVLSFSFSKKQGEIFINLGQKTHSLLYLFIHALLHLKGFKHSARMKEWEKRLMKKHGSQHISRT